MLNNKTLRSSKQPWSTPSFDHTSPSSMLAKNATQRVIAIPELLDLIFSFTDKRSNASCARVCKSWSDVALACLWRDLDSSRPAFSLLSPLATDGLESPDPQTFRTYVSHAFHSCRRLSTVFSSACFQINRSGLILQWF